MKKLLLLLALLAFSATSSFAQIKITENFTVTGFFDMSSTYDTETKSNNLSFDQFEVDLIYNYGHGLMAQADINSLSGGSVDLEQAFVTYKAPNGFSITGGKFLSCSGWGDRRTHRLVSIFLFCYTRLWWLSKWCRCGVWQWQGRVLWFCCLQCVGWVRYQF